MTSKKFGLGMLVVVLAFSMLFIGCATTSSVGGTVDTHGIFSFNTAARTGEAIASYGVILGLFSSGYETYVSAVRRAINEGKVVTSETVQYLGLYTKITAYASN